MSKEGLKIFLDKRIADIKRYLEINGREEDEENFSPSEELTICNIAKNTIALEEELGCPLEVVGKAILQNCIYVLECEDYKETEIGFINQDGEKGYVISVDEWENGNQVWLSDYKKTWWLKEDKSE